MVFFKALFAAFNPFGFLKGITLKGWLTIGAILVLIGFGLLVRYYWNDYHNLQKENVVKEEQNKQLAADNYDLGLTIDLNNQSEGLNNLFSDINFTEKNDNSKKYKSIIDSKKKELDKIPLVTPEEISNKVVVDEATLKEREKARSEIRWSKIQQAYCLTQPECKVSEN